MHFELLNSEIPNDWDIKTIDQITDINKRIELKSFTDESDVSFIPMECVEADSGKLDLSRIKKLGEVKKGYKQFINGDIIYARITPCMENGKIAIVKDLINGIGYGSTEFVVIRPHRNTSAAYIRYYLMQKKIRAYAKSKMKGTAGQLRVPPEIISTMKIPLPNLEIQQKIIEKIETLFTRLDAGIHALKIAQMQLEAYRQSLLKAAVQGDLTHTWRETHLTEIESASLLLTRILMERRRKWEEDYIATQRSKGKAIKDSKWKIRYHSPNTPEVKNLPILPEKWCWTTPESLSNSEKYSLAIGPFGSDLKVSDYRDHGTPLIFVRNIRSETFSGLDDHFVSPEKAQELKNHLVEGGDILITKMGEPPGDACIYPKNLPKAIITADCIKWKLTSMIDHTKLFVHFIHSSLVKNQIIRITSGVAQKKVSLERFSTMPFPLPPLLEQKEILEILENQLLNLKEIRKTIDLSIKQISNLRSSILMQAFQGNLI